MVVNSVVHFNLPGHAGRNNPSREKSCPCIQRVAGKGHCLPDHDHNYSGILRVETSLFMTLLKRRSRFNSVSVQKSLEFAKKSSQILGNLGNIWKINLWKFPQIWVPNHSFCQISSQPKRKRFRLSESLSIYVVQRSCVDSEARTQAFLHRIGTDVKMTHERYFWFILRYDLWRMDS